MFSPRLLGLMFAWVTVAVCAALLVSAHPVLLVALIETPRVPLGTPVTAIGLLALALGLRQFFAPLDKAPPVFDRALARFQGLSVGLAMSWIPVSALLAGNLSFEFAPGDGFQGGELASRVFWWFTYGQVALALSLALLRGLIRTAWRFTHSPPGPGSGPG